MPLLVPPNADYSDKDFDQLHARLRNLIRSVFPTWTEESVANFGNILVQQNAHVGDVLGYYLDKWARESRIVTAELRRSLVGLVKLIGFQAAGATAATVDLEIEIAGADPGATVTLAQGRIAKTAEITEPARFQVLEDIVFAAGESEKTETLENSEYRSNQFISAGTPNQSFRLSGTPFLEGSDVVVAGDGTYSRVDNFLDSDSTERHYVVTVDAQDRATIRFGNGVNGTIPQGTLDVTYKIGGGSSANVEADKVVIFEGVVRDSLGNTVTVTVNNPAKASPGVNRQSNAQIKILAPRSLRVLSRAIAREDYEIVAEQVTGVARALMLFKNQEPAIAENTGMLFIVPVGGGVATSALLDEVRSHFEQVTGFDPPSHPKPNTLALLVQTAPYTVVNITAHIFKRAGVLPATARAALDAALEVYFAVEITASELIAADPVLAAASGITAADGDSLVKNPRIGFGFEYKDADGDPIGLLPWSDVLNVVRDAPVLARVDPGASGLLLNGARDDVAIGNFNFPVLGTTTYIDGDTGLQL